MKRLFIIVSLMLSLFSVRAQDKISRAELEARIDYMQEFIGDDVIAHWAYVLYALI